MASLGEAFSAVRTDGQPAVHHGSHLLEPTSVQILLGVGQDEGRRVRQRQEAAHEVTRGCGRLLSAAAHVQPADGDPGQAAQERRRQGEPEYWDCPVGELQQRVYPRSIITASTGSRIDKFHPTQKPVELFEYLIRTYSNVGDVVPTAARGYLLPPWLPRQPVHLDLHRARHRLRREGYATHQYTRCTLMRGYLRSALRTLRTPSTSAAFGFPKYGRPY